MKIGAEISVKLRRRAVQTQLTDLLGDVVAAVAKQGAEQARNIVHVRSGRLRDSIVAEPIAPLVWGIYARTPYALIEEIRHPYLVVSALSALHQIDGVARQYTL